MAQIQIKNLTFTYPNQDKSAISDFNLDIVKGDFVVICGKTGCGKSTLLRNLKPVIRPSGGVHGEILIGGFDINKMSNREQCKKIGFVFQNPEHQIVTDKVWHELAFGLENLGENKEVIRLRVSEIAEYFGISHWFYKSTGQLSGGQKQILNLAAVMVMDPEILVLDEPTAYLDPISADKFIELVKKINKDFGITVIMSEHKLDAVLECADKLIVLKDGKQVEKDNISDTIKALERDELIHIMPAAARIFLKADENGECPLNIAQARSWLSKKNIAKLCEPESANQKNEEVISAPNSDNCKISNLKKAKNEDILSAKNIWFRYSKKEEDVLRGVELSIKKGELFCVLGGNGSGKTTMLSILSGINKPLRGKLKIKGTTALLPQDVQTLFCCETVKDELKSVEQSLIDDMELNALVDRHPYDLSGGQQQKLALAKVLSTNPDILLFDEPTKGLDGIYKRQLGKLLRSLTKKGKTILMVSHDLDFCGQYADRCGLFARGEMVSVDTYRKFFYTNHFYTTSACKIARGKIEGAVNEEDILACIKD